MERFVALSLLFMLAVPAAAAERAFPSVVTQADNILKYQEAALGGEKVKVLVMPGHEPAYGGTEHQGLRERDLMVDVANKVARDLSTDPLLEVAVARDTLAWSDDLSEYFEEEWDEIEDFVEAKKRIWKRAVRKSDVEVRDFEPAHNTAATDVALRLYGITKWASEEGYDVVLHLHLNDTGAQNHQGFAVYIPDKEFGNAQASRPLGEAIAKELSQYNASSTLPIENYAVVEDQSLIALGSYNTADFASVLIEYAYIYEPKIKNPEARDAVLSDMAHQTARGVRAYLGAPPAKSDTLALPHIWTQSELALGESSPQAYALQVGLRKLGFYPPAGHLLIGCPVSGEVGECTKQAVRAFQASKGLEQTGTIGPRTKAALETAGL